MDGSSKTGKTTEEMNSLLKGAQSMDALTIELSNGTVVNVNYSSLDY